MGRLRRHGDSASSGGLKKEEEEEEEGESEFIVLKPAAILDWLCLYYGT
jgi:hypothetical protein